MLIVHFELYRFSLGEKATSFERIFDLLEIYSILTREQRQFKQEPVTVNSNQQYGNSQKDVNSMNLPLYSQNDDRQSQYSQQKFSFHEKKQNERYQQNEEFLFQERGGSDQMDYSNRYPKMHSGMNKNSYKKYN